MRYSSSYLEDRKQRTSIVFYDWLVFIKVAILSKKQTTSMAVDEIVEVIGLSVKELKLCNAIFMNKG